MRNKNNHYLPLQAFFTDLQRHPDFSLGLAEYQALLHVLEKDPNSYLAADEAASNNLLRLCKLLWLKPNQNQQLFQKLFDEAQAAFKKEIDAELNKKEETKDNEPSLDSKTDIKPTTEPDNKTEPKTETKPETKPNDTPDMPRLYLNFQAGGGESMQAKPLIDKSLLLVRDYIPFQWRELIQIWRRLKDRKGASASTDEIDMEASVQKMNREGYLLAPIYKKRVQNQANLITLIDHRGSMVAFKNLAQAIADSATKAGIQNQTYYFRNVPQRYNDAEALLYVYADRGQIKHRPLLDILKKQPNTAVLIISDAGTASGSYNMSRIEATEVFLTEVYKHTLKVAWLNPMPQNRWDGSSAYIIRELTNMFEATPQGLQKALPILKGRQMPRSPIVFPELLKQW